MKLLVEQGGSAHIGFSYTPPEFDASILALDLYGRQIALGIITPSPELATRAMAFTGAAIRHLEQEPRVVADKVHRLLASTYLPHLIYVDGLAATSSPEAVLNIFGCSQGRLQLGARVARGMLRPVYPVEAVPRATTRHHTVETRG